jgi:hypothetical protein
MITLEVNLTNGNKHTVVYEQSKEEFFDLIKFNRDVFLKDKNDTYFIVSSIMSFRIQGASND